MAFTLTKNARLAADRPNLEPQLVLKIDGVATAFGVRLIYKKAKVGDDGLYIDGTWKVGGNVALQNQSDLISLDDTTTSIRQQLQPDKGIGSSISSMQVALIDKNLEVTKLVSPGVVVEDILGRRARVYLGFQGVAFPEDYITIFRGLIDDIQAGPGKVTLTLSHPDQKKRQTLFPKVQTSLTSSITSGATSCTVDSTENFAHGTVGNGLRCYFKIGDEYLERVKTGTANVYTITRGALGTTAVSHAAGDSVETFYRLAGPEGEPINVIDAALRLMLSDDAVSPYAEDVAVGSFVQLDTGESIANGVFFRDVDMAEEYGVTVGDKMTITGATETANNISAEPENVITAIEKIEIGTVITLGNAALVEELDTSAVVSFVSQYNILGAGLGMSPDEVDIAEHLRIKRTFLSGFYVDLYIKDEENIKDLIEKDLYAIAGAYSLPRKSKASVGYHIGPIPGTDTKIISKAQIKDPSKITVRRSLANNFANTIIYKLDQELGTDDFAKGVVTRAEESVARIPVGTKATVIEARGMRSNLAGVSLAVAASNRRLDRYKFGAEYIEQLKVTFSSGFSVEVGDIVLLDSTELSLINSASGDRSPAPKLYEVINKAIDLRSGDVSFSLVDTRFSNEAKYALISPSSYIKSGASQTEFVIEAGFSTETYGTAEGKKWSRFLESGGTVGVRIRSSDFSRNATSTIATVVGNSVTLAAPLGFTPQAGDLLEVCSYSQGEITEIEKTLYGFMSPLTGADPYQMI